MCKLTNSFYSNIDILIVEDKIIDAIKIKKSLQNMNYSISGIETTQKEAIEHVKINRPDVILINISLNNSLIGIETASQMWKSFKVPIIFLTAKFDEKTMKKVLDCEPYAYLIKPFKDEDLKVSIELTLHKHKYFFLNKIDLDNLKDDFIVISESLKFDRSKAILFKNNEEIQLTKNEKKLFEIMSEKPNEIISFNRISTYIWRETLYDMGKLRTLFYRLRLKIGMNPFENIYEEGYKIKTLH